MGLKIIMPVQPLDFLLAEQDGNCGVGMYVSFIKPFIYSALVFIRYDT